MRTLLIFTLGSLIGAAVGYALASADAAWTEADDAELALEEASMEPYRAALGWNATGEAIVANPSYQSSTTGWTLASGIPYTVSVWTKSKADCE